MKIDLGGVALVAVAAVSSGCMLNSDNSEVVGSFEVNATRSESCGDAGLLGTPPSMTFEASLTQVGHRALHWRDAQVGLLIGDFNASDNSFKFSEAIVADMRQDAPELLPPCSIRRDLTLAGTLSGEAPSWTSFDATMRYAYTPTTGSSCEDLLVQPDAISDALPCTISFELQGSQP